MLGAVETSKEPSGWSRVRTGRPASARLRGAGDPIGQVSEPRAPDVLFLHEMSKHGSETTGFVSAESLWVPWGGETGTGENGGWRPARRPLHRPGERCILRGFTWVDNQISSLKNKKSMKRILWSSSHRWIKWGLERTGNFSRITEWQGQGSNLPSPKAHSFLFSSLTPNLEQIHWKRTQRSFKAEMTKLYIPLGDINYLMKDESWFNNGLYQWRNILKKLS